MKMQSVSSSNIDSVGYDDEKKVLRIKFNSGNTYDYEGVEKITYEQLINANSVGSFFHRHIRDQYGYTQVS